MSTFRQISELIKEEYLLNMTVQLKNGKMSVVVVPKFLDEKSELGKKSLQPIVLTGSPDQIDLGLALAITNPVRDLNDLIVSGGSFVKESKDSPKAKEEKEDPKPATPKPAEKPKETASEPVATDEESDDLPDNLDEDTGELMPGPEDDDTGAILPDNDESQDPAPESEAKAEVAAAENQQPMFDDDDWT